MKWRPLLYRSPSRQLRQAIAPAKYSNLKCVSRLRATRYYRTPNSLLIIMTRLVVGRSEICILAARSDCSVLQIAHTVSGVHITFHVKETGSFPRSSVWGMMLNSHLHLAPKLRMGGALSLLPIYAFTAWAGKIFFFNLAQQPPVGQGLLIHEVSRSRTTTQHSR